MEVDEEKKEEMEKDVEVEVEYWFVERQEELANRQNSFHPICVCAGSQVR